MGDNRAARDAFERLVEANPVSARGHLALGALLSSPAAPELADLKEAEAQFRRVHKINGKEIGTMVRLGELFIVMGEMAQARHWLDSAAQTNLKSADAAFLSGYVRWETGDLEGARSFYRRAVKALKTDAPVQGVLSEGDRKATAATPAPLQAAKVAAPPLTSPMGKTLFGAFVSALREAGQVSDGTSLCSSDLDRIYSPVRDHSRTLARQLSTRSS